jgi:hypothetical protein
MRYLSPYISRVTDNNSITKDNLTREKQVYLTKVLHDMGAFRSDLKTWEELSIFMCKFDEK